MGLLDKIAGREKARQEGEERQERAAYDGREDRQPLTKEERERVIEEGRSELDDLDRKVEENLDRLRELSKS